MVTLKKAGRNTYEITIELCGKQFTSSSKTLSSAIEFAADQITNWCTSCYNAFGYIENEYTRSELKSDNRVRNKLQNGVEHCKAAGFSVVFAFSHPKKNTSSVDEAIQLYKEGRELDSIRMTSSSKDSWCRIICSPVYSIESDEVTICTGHGRLKRCMQWYATYGELEDKLHEWVYKIAIDELGESL